MKRLLDLLGSFEAWLLRLHTRLREKHLYRVIAFYVLVVGIIRAGAEYVLAATRFSETHVRILVFVAFAGLPVVVLIGLLTAPSYPARPAPDPRPGPPPSRGPLLPGVASLVVIVFGLMLIGGIAVFGDRPLPREVGGHRLAVLPFLTFDRSDDSARAANEVHGEFTRQLGHLHAFQVTSGNSTHSLGPSATPRQVARRLGVQTIVQGTVRTEGQRAAVAIALVDGHTADTVWSQEYRVDRDRLSRLPGRMVRDVAAALEVKLSLAERRRLGRILPYDTVAYEHYSAALRLRREREPEPDDVRVIEDHYRIATERDPLFALAFARLSMFHSRMYFANQDPGGYHLRAAEQAVDSALALDPDLPEGHLARGLFYYWCRKDYKTALAELELAAEGLPSDAEVHAALGYIYRRQGRWDEALTRLRRAAELDPLWADRFVEVGYTLRARREYAAADSAFRRAIETDSNYYVAALERGELWVLWQGRVDTLQVVLSRFPREFDPRGDVSWTTYQAAMLRRDYDGALRALDNAQVDSFIGQTYYHPKPFLHGLALYARSDVGGGRRQMALAAQALERALRRDRTDPWIRVGLARAYALLGRRDEAHREATAARAEVTDSLSAPVMRYQVALVYAATGSADLAVRELAPLLRVHAGTTVHQLRLDPGWDPIRDHPGFRALTSVPD